LSAAVLQEQLASPEGNIVGRAIVDEMSILAANVGGISWTNVRGIHGEGYAILLTNAPGISLMNVRGRIHGEGYRRILSTNMAALLLLDRVAIAWHCIRCWTPLSLLELLLLYTVAFAGVAFAGVAFAGGRKGPNISAHNKFGARTNQN
jgi:hypothetical protein